MTPQGILEIAADLAAGRPTASKAITAVTGYLDAIPGGAAALKLLDEAERHAGECCSLALVLCLHCGRAADVAASLRRAARQSRFGVAA
jgi:hypothetical protein